MRCPDQRLSDVERACARDVVVGQHEAVGRGLRLGAGAERQHRGDLRRQLGVVGVEPAPAAVVAAVGVPEAVEERGGIGAIMGPTRK